MLGESKVANKSSPVIVGYHGARLPAVLLLFALIPLAATLQVTQNQSYASTPLNCQPSVQNQYPENANAGQKIVITTTVTNTCISDYNQVIVKILLPNTSVTLSTSAASPATNMVTAPATGGPWRLIVQVLWINYPADGTIAILQTTITIQINGPPTISTVTSHTESSTKFTSSRIASSTVSSAVTSVKVSSSAAIPYSTAISSNFTSTSVLPTATNETTFNAASTLPSYPFSNILPYAWLASNGVLILAVVVILLLVGVFALRRRRR